MTNRIDRILVIEARRPGFTRLVPLGIAARAFSGWRHDGWRFTPFTVFREESRKGYSTWEKSLPRWTGGIDGTESISMLPDETIGEALKRFPAVPEAAR